jgi:predicted PurR-regulated permease PerM
VSAAPVLPRDGSQTAGGHTGGPSPAAHATGPRPWQRRLFLALSACAVVALIVAARAVLLPFVLALVVAYVLTPSVCRVERLRIPRWIAILVVYALSLGAVGGFVSVIVPRLVLEGRTLAHEWPKLTRAAREVWLPAVDAKISSWQGAPPAPPPPASGAPVAAPAPTADDKFVPFHVVKNPDGSVNVEVSDGIQIREVRERVWQIEQVPEKKPISSGAMLEQAFDKASAYLSHNAFEVLKVGQLVVGAVSRGIFNLFMTLMLGAYLILTHEKILAFFRELFAPPAQPAFDRFLRRLDRGLSGVVRGQLLICFVNGVLSAVGFWLFDLKYWPILAVVAAVMSLIPIFGSILSSVPAVAIGLTQSPATAFGVLAWIVGIHQLEANFLNPKIIGDAAKIHPVLVVFSLLAGEHFLGITGALFAVPCMSIAQTVFLHFRETTLGLADPLASVAIEGPRPAAPAEPTSAGEAGA